MGNLSNKHSDTINESVEHDTSIRDFLFKCLYSWKWFVLSIIICLIAGTLFYLCSQNEYLITSSVILKEDKNTTSKAGPMAQLESLGLLNTTNNIDNEIAVLTSPNLMRQIILNNQLYVTYQEKGLLKNTEVYNKCPYYVQLENISPLELKGNIEISIKQHGGKTEIQGKYTYDREKYDIKTTLDKLPGTIDLPAGLGKLGISYRDNTTDQQSLERDYIVSIANAQTVAYDYISLLNVSPITKSSSVLKLNLKVENVDKGIDILDDIVKIYNKNNVKDNSQMAINTSKFVKERMDTVELELRSVENQIVNYKKTQGITDVSAEANLYVQQTGLLEQKKIDIETQLKTIELVENYVKKAEDNQLIPNLGITDPGLAQIISNYNNLILDYGRLEETTNKDNPTRIRTLSSINNTRQSIIDAVNNVKKSMNISKSEINKQADLLGTKKGSVPNQERGLLEIVRQQQTKQALLLYLMQVEAETNITMASTADKAKVITDPIIPEHPISPKKKLILGFSFLLGVFIPIGLLYLKDFLQTKISNREELERLSKVSIIGEIMQKDKNNTETIVVQSNNTSSIVELFRAIRNNIQFILNTSSKNVILVTSTMPGEGKTFVSINLAASYTLSNKKVLLIGMDIRNPRLASDIGFKKGVGLTSYLSGSENNWQSMLTNLKEYPNLDILQAGTIPPNPNELLMRPELKQLLSEARQVYDIIILDSAPIGVVSDTFLIADIADITVYVTRENVTPKNALQFINQVSEDKKLPDMYLVLNGVDFSKRTKGRGKYGYGQTYGYGVRK